MTEKRTRRKCSPAFDREAVGCWSVSPVRRLSDWRRSSGAATLPRRCKRKKVQHGRHGLKDRALRAIFDDPRRGDVRHFSGLDLPGYLGFRRFAEGRL